MTAAEVVRALGAARPLDRGSAPWTLRFIEIADRQFGGAWRAMHVDGARAMQIVLPPHAGEPCHGDRMALVPARGASVAEAAAILRDTRPEYAAANLSCWSRISAAQSEPFSLLILATAPLDTSDHRDLPARANALYHLDGFHRLVGWALAGRLTEGARIPAIVAG